MTDVADDAVAPGFVDRQAKSEYVRLALACFLISFTTAHTTLLAIVFAHDGYDLHQVGLLLSLIAAPIIAFALLSGEVMARLGALGTLRTAMVLIAVGFGSLVLTRMSFGPALVSRMIQGAGLGLFLAAAYTYVQSRLDTTRFLFLLGVFSAAMPVSQGIAPPIGNFVMQHFGENAMFVVATVPGIAAVLLTFRLRRLPPPARTGRLQLASGFRRGVWEPLLAVFMNGTLFGFCTAYLAAALVARGIPLAAFFTATLFTMFASRLLALRSIESINRRVLVASGLALMSGGLLAVALFGTTIPPVVAAGVAFGFGYSLTYPVISGWISEGLDASERAGPQALLNASFNIGLYVMPLPETAFVAHIGYGGAMTVLALAGFTTSGLLLARAARIAYVHPRFK